MSRESRNGRAGMIYVPPHTRNGKSIKGYWRKKRKGSGYSSDASHDEVPVIDTNQGIEIGRATVSDGEIDVEYSDPAPEGSRISVTQPDGSAKKGTVVGYKTREDGTRVAMVLYDSYGSDTWDAAYAPTGRIEACEETIPNVRMTSNGTGEKQNNGECHYVGVFVQRERIDAVCYDIKRRPLEKPIKSPHITLGYKPLKYDESLFGEKVKVTITGYGVDKDNEGVSVKLHSDNPAIQEQFDRIEHPHITLSISKTGKAKNTKNLKFEDVDEERSFYMTYGGFFD